MTTLTDPDSRLVYGVDVLASVVSIARISENDLAEDIAPQIGNVAVTTRGRSHTPYTQWRRASTAADEVFAKITSGGTVKPSLVIFSKQLWGATTANGKRGVTADPTAQRRMALQALIEDRLHQAEIPVAEFPYPTAIKWLTGSGLHQGPQMNLISKIVAQTWGIETPRVTVGGEERPEIFRMQVVSLAAIAAMVCGIETKIEVTESRLLIAGGEGNQAVQFPRNRICPETVEDWNLLHRSPALLTV